MTRFRKLVLGAFRALTALTGPASGEEQGDEGLDHVTLSLSAVQAMSLDQVREFVRDVGIAWANASPSPYSALDILRVVLCHGTLIADVMERAFLLARPALRKHR